MFKSVEYVNATHLQEGQTLGSAMAQKVLLVRGGVLGSNTGIGGAHHSLAASLGGGGVAGWGLHDVAEYNLGPRPGAFQRVFYRWFKHPRTVAQLSQKKHGANLIHITDQEQAHLVPRRSDAPVIVTVHDLFHLYPYRQTVGTSTVEIGDSNPSWIRRRDLKKLRQGLARADLLLCDSQATLKACKKYFPNVDSIWLPLGLDIERFAPPNEMLHAPVGPAAHLEKACHLLIVGSHDPRKRMDFLLRVIGSIHPSVKQDLRIHHVGNGASPINGLSMSELAQQASIDRFYAHGGDLSEDALMDLRHASEVLLFPSISEGFGYPPIEALATGTPVLCADMPSHNELMPEGTCLPADDVKAWQGAIMKVHEAWKKRTESHDEHVWPTPDEHLIQHAKTFSIEQFNQRTAEAYNRFN